MFPLTASSTNSWIQLSVRQSTLYMCSCTLCSSQGYALEALGCQKMTNFCLWATGKTNFFHISLELGTQDFIVRSLWPSGMRNFSSDHSLELCTIYTTCTCTYFLDFYMYMLRCSVIYIHVDDKNFWILVPLRSYELSIQHSGDHFHENC